MRHKNLLANETRKYIKAVVLKIDVTFQGFTDNYFYGLPIFLSFSGITNIMQLFVFEETNIKFIGV